MVEEPVLISPDAINPESKDAMSPRERKWFSDWFVVMEKNQKAQVNYLRNINTAVQIVAVIVLLSAILGACQLLLR